MPGAGERLLAAKLRLLSGTSDRRTSAALSVLTGGRVELPRSAAPARHRRRQFAARTVYLSERHLHDIDHIIEALQNEQPQRWNRSAVLRHAVEQLRATVETQSLENE